MCERQDLSCMRIKPRVDDAHGVSRETLCVTTSCRQLQAHSRGLVGAYRTTSKLKGIYGQQTFLRVKRVHLGNHHCRTHIATTDKAHGQRGVHLQPIPRAPTTQHTIRD